MAAVTVSTGNPVVTLSGEIDMATAQGWARRWSRGCERGVRSSWRSSGRRVLVSEGMASHRRRPVEPSPFLSSIAG
jgi:hypothetical protein